MNKTQEIIAAACRKLEITVQDLEISLQPNLRSISLLEEVILAIKDMGDKSALNGACFMVGAYLGEIIRLELGGEWSVGGEEELPSLQLGDAMIYPIVKAKEFADIPNGESLQFYANALLAIQRGKA